MDTSPNPENALSSAEELAADAREKLEAVALRLKAARKVLARDWETLTPRERSFHSRQVKDIEEEQQALLDLLR